MSAAGDRHAGRDQRLCVDLPIERHNGQQPKIAGIRRRQGGFDFIPARASVVVVIGCDRRCLCR
jgi:hypothetical protein